MPNFFPFVIRDCFFEDRGEIELQSTIVAIRRDISVEICADDGDFEATGHGELMGLLKQPLLPLVKAILQNSEKLVLSSMTRI